MNFPSGPPHHHPATEVLYALAGRGTWSLTDGPTISLPAGATVFLPEGVAHSFCAMDAPMAAVYLCLGEVDPLPVLA